MLQARRAHRLRPVSRTWSHRVLVATWTSAAIWVVVVSVTRGRALQRKVPAVFLGAAPLVGRNARDGWDWRFSWSLIAAAAVAGAVITGCACGWWARLRLRWLLLATAVASSTFATLLALTDGSDGILYGAQSNTEYLINVPKAPSGTEYLRSFVHLVNANAYSVHVRGHPPGFLGLLKFLNWLGIGGAWTTALLSVVATGVSALCVLVVVRVIADRSWVDRVAPFLVVAPYLIWMVTSADAVYTSLGAVGTAAIAFGATRSGRTAAACGTLGGIALGCLLFGTYLGAVFLMVPLALWLVLWRQRHRVPAAVGAGAVIGLLVIVLAFRAGGFWWLDGLRATNTAYNNGSAKIRPWSYFAVGNIGAALLAVGPAFVAGIAGLRDRRIWAIAGAGLLAVAVSHLSKYTKAEVERIWLLFYPWLTVAAGSLFAGRRLAKRSTTGALWVGVQASCAILLQSALVTKW